LNELECIGDYVLANIWQSNQFVVIHIPQQKVVQSFDLNSLAKMAQNKASWPIDVMNGLAWNEKRRTLWITGKYWPLLFELYMPEGEWQ
jgi:glutaminyl-peptide cyclotransferase